MSEATVTWVSGPVVRARAAGPFMAKESALVGDAKLLGEVVRIIDDDIVVQVYEDTTGLRPGVRLRGTGRLLDARLGPGLLGGIYDGLLRPLPGAGHHLMPGMRPTPPRTFPFFPTVQVGERLAGGAVFGRVRPGERREQLCLVPPLLAGEVVKIAAAGEYADNAPILALRDAEGHERLVSMNHTWPIRLPRPYRRRLPASEPLLTGQRILDSLFPLARGGKAALPGGFGTGKTVLQETLAKYCDADVIVYAGCGERGNEMASLLHEFVELSDPRTGRPLLERTVIIANTSNMPVAAREASIYTAVTVAEYFRDQGLNVALMADSTSRWAEALREVSGRLGELPGEAGYPAYLSSALAEFYERAARVETLAGTEGSVTLIGAVSPPSGDFSEPVVTHTRRYVRTYWALDPHRASARFYPAVNPLLSYSTDADALSDWWHGRGNPEWSKWRARFLQLLTEKARLERMVRIIGKDALPPRQRLTLLCADLVDSAFLNQSAYSPIDHAASPARQSAMMRLLIRFFDLAEAALATADPAQMPDPDRFTALPFFRRLQRMGEEIPEQAPEQFDALLAQMESEMASATERSTPS